VKPPDPHPLARPIIHQLGLPPPVLRDDLLADGIQDHASNTNPHGGAYRRYPAAVPRALQQRYADALNDGLAEHDADRTVDADQILLCGGSISGLELMVRTFCEPGLDTVVATPPTFGFYERAALVNGARFATIALDPPQFTALDVDAILSHDPKVTFVCRPNNPTGTVVPRDAIVDLVTRTRGFVVVDETYIDFADVASLLPLLRDHPNLVVTRTFSKAWGAAGVRVGAVIAEPSILWSLRVVQPTYEVGGPALDQMSDLLHRADELQAIVRAIKADRDLLAEQLRAVPCVEGVLASQANFLLVHVNSPGEVAGMLADLGIAVMDASSDIPGCLRVSVSTRAENDRLVEVLSSWPGSTAAPRPR
jgi:histidinol-phosphate aminotransferase